MKTIHAIYSALIFLVVCCIVGGLVIARQVDHRFDMKCLDSGRGIEYRVLEGQNQRVKECK